MAMWKARLSVFCHFATIFSLQQFSQLFHSPQNKFTTIFNFLLLCSKCSIEVADARKQTEKWSFLWKNVAIFLL